jgi:hypothetical protein
MVARLLTALFVLQSTARNTAYVQYGNSHDDSTTNKRVVRIVSHRQYDVISDYK